MRERKRERGATNVTLSLPLVTSHMDLPLTRPECRAQIFGGPEAVFNESEANCFSIRFVYAAFTLHSSLPRFGLCDLSLTRGQRG